MIDKKNIQKVIRENFVYLKSDFNFVEEFTNDETNSEVRYKKNDWIISIVTTAHNTKISLSIISPSNSFGFLSFYFKELDPSYGSALNLTKGLEADIKYNSDFLKSKCLDILEGNPKHLNQILELVKSEHLKYMKPLLRKQNEQ